MKNYILIAFICLGTITIAQNKTQEINIKVFGNCPQCKERIENALDTKGVKFVEWNVETKNCKVVYKTNRITEEEIHQKIANVGHDTEKAKANDSVYLSLPDCCLFRENPNTHHD